ncbi:MAG: SH3 domain-containing C40 family peptidase [bacterium]|nr:SH3 domain-containing C40 family peptidase [bacterium]
MKRKEIKFAALTAAVCATVLLCPTTTRSRAIGNDSPSGQAIAGISLSINNYYKDTYSDITSSISMTDAFIAAKKDVTQETKDDNTNSEYKNIGIANVATYLNVREKADESSDIVGILPKNGGCYIYSVNPDGWAKIRSGDITGYVSSRFLVTGGEVSALAKKVGSRIATVNAVTVRIREKKSTESATLALIPKGEEVEVLNDSDDQWLYVRVDDDKGYVSRELVDVKYQLAKATDSEEEAAVAASGGSVSTTSSIRSKMVSYAKKFLGGKYVYGGTSLTSGIDCSAFMMRIYEHFGYSITRTSRSQAEAGTAIKLAKVKPGDLVFYDRNGTINHVAMYIGNGKIIHASNPRSGIKISNMYYKMPYKAVRFLED